MIDHGTIQRIFDASDIVDVISDFVKLKKAGANYKGLSPFTNEKSPSFMVSPSKQIFKCFSSGIGGNVVSFLMEQEKLSYPEALKYLAKKYNIEIVEKQRTEEEIQQDSEKESLGVVTSFAHKYFQEILHQTEEGRAIGLSYFRERDMRDDIIKLFQLGYAPSDRKAFTKAALEKGYKKEFLVKSGLTIEKEDYAFDRFHGRAMFPIHSLSGNVIAFGGRILKKDDKTAKYLNSPESELYHKSRVLYGIYFAKQDIVKLDKCFLVEGYTDVISLFQAGVKNVVSSSGTALTKDQVRLVKRFTNNLTILYDGDEAGIKASFRGIDLVLEEGVNLKVLLLPEGEDPDSFARKNSAEGLKQFIHDNEEDFISFKVKLLSRQTKNDPVARANMITDVVRSISIIPDNIVRSVYIQDSARILHLEESFLYAEINKLRKSNADQQHKREKYQGERKTSPQHFTGARMMESDDVLEKDIIRLILNYGNYGLFTDKEEGTEEETEISVIQYIIDELTSDEIELANPVYKTIFNEFIESVGQKQYLDERYFIHHANDKIAKTAADLLSTSYNLSNIWKKHDALIETEEMKLKEIIPETVIAYKSKKILELLAEVENEIKTAQDSKNIDQIMQLQQKAMALNSIKKSLARNLGQRIILK
jgi:DNA primase